MTRLMTCAKGTKISVMGRIAWVGGSVRRDPVGGDDVVRVWFDGALGPQDLPADSPVEVVA